MFSTRRPTWLFPICISIALQAVNPCLAQEPAVKAPSEAGAKPSAPPAQAVPVKPQGSVQETPVIDASAQIRATRRNETLKRFGSEFFETSRADLSGSQDLVVPSDHVLNPGDHLAMVLYNVKGGESSYSLAIDHNGAVFIPTIGPVQLSGLTIEGARARLESKAAAISPNLRVRLTVDNVQKIRAFVLGESRRPGVYALNPNATALDLLLLSGGPSNLGSYRRVELRRNGRLIDVIDLYRVIERGQQATPRILDGDRLVIPLSGPQVTLNGMVARPAIYELDHEFTLQQALDLAGGLAPGAYSPRLMVERAEKNKTRQVLDVSPKQTRTYRIQGGDSIMVQELLEDLSNGVYLDGAVNRPGWYQYRNGMRVSELLQIAQGPKSGVYPGHAEVYRSDGPEKPVRMIGFDLGLALRGDPQNNLTLSPRDRIMVYDARTAAFNRQKVRIQGQVSRPGEFDWYPNMRVKDLIVQAGGLTPDASAKAEITRRKPEGGFDKRQVDLQGALSGAETAATNPVLENLDLLVVRPGLRASMWPATVTLAGEVKNPGVYTVDPAHTTLQALIQEAGGLSDLAYQPGAVLMRKHEEIVQSDHEELAKDVFSTLQTIANQIAVVEMARLTATSKAQGQTTIDLQGLTKDKATLPARWIDRILASGRIPMNLTQVMQGKGDPGVREGDVIFVPRAPNTVIVAGAVTVPSAILFEPGLGINDYIARAGSFTDDAYEERILVMRVSGETYRASEAPELRQGDIILVPPRAIVSEPDAFDRFLQALGTVVNGAVLWRYFR